jgi:TetR/AcrR family transcriptional regulator, copper-responsive repressor
MVQNKVPGARRRGRPRAYDPAAALIQARDAFWRHGYSGTSLEEISAATGMNRPSLSAAFGDKRALYLAALRDYWISKFAAVDRALAGGTLQEALLRVCDMSLSLYISDADGARGCFVVGTAITEAVEDAEIRAIIQAGLGTLDAKFRERLVVAQQAREIDADADVEALAVLVTATMHTLAIRARAGAPRKELRQLARKMVRVLCR